MDLSVAELDPWATLPALGDCGALTSLRLLLREPMAPELAVLDVGALPQRLEQLALRHVVATADEATQRRCGAGGEGGLHGGSMGRASPMHAPFRQPACSPHAAGCMGSI